MKKNTIVSLLLAAVLLLSACGQTTQSQIAYVEEAVMGPVLLDKEAAALDTAQPAAAPQLLLAQPSGKLTKKGTEAIQHYEEAFALDEEICAADKSGRSSVPGRRVGQALSNLYLQAGEAFLKRDATRAETFLERSLDYDSNNARAREALKKLQAAE